MAIKLFLNVTLADKKDVAGLVKKIERVPNVDQVLTISKRLKTYIGPDAPKNFVPRDNPVDLVIYVSARTYRQATQTVLNVRNVSDGQIGTTVTNFVFPEKKSTTKAARGQK